MFVEAIKRGLSNYVNFSGRSPRWEFWYWVLFVIIASIVASVIDTVLLGVDVAEGDFSPVQTITGLALFIPGIAIGVRRLHDIDRTGWWYLLALTLIGLILLLIWACIRGTPGPNRFGPDPLAGMAGPRPLPA
jgi:uncharacterized membrane protein YhaH (DUF805 family)